MSNNEVVIFNSPLYFNSFDDGETYLPPLGQGYIVSNLVKHGIEAKLIDCVHLRMGVNEIIDYINSERFSHAGFNVFSINLTLVKEILAGIKRDIHIYLGGKAIEYLWKEIASWNVKNPITIIIGEGELIFPDLIIGTCLDSPVYEDGNVRVYAVTLKSNYYPMNLNCLYLDRSIFQNREIINHYGQIESCIIASRECIYNCAFCGGARSINPNTIPRIRNNDSLKEEIHDIINLCPDVSSIRVLDDLFLRNRKSIINACDLFSSFPKIYWRCMAHINTFINNLDLTNLLIESGCKEVFLGIESGSPEIRRLIRKQGTVENVINVVGALLSAGIDVKGYFMGGFPGETEKQLRQTVQLSNKLHLISMNTLGNFRATAFQFRPYHGTALYNQIISQTSKKVDYFYDHNYNSSKKQYSFSAGNYSEMDDKIIHELLSSINQR